MPKQSNYENESCTVEGLVNKIKRESADGNYIYRGEPEHYKKVSSNLYREYDIEAEHFHIEEIQNQILDDAKKYEDKSDEEILAKVQHYGGKTNLIDFTNDLYVALFFACDGSPHKDGRVILQKTDMVKDIIMKPSATINRVVSQKSVFVRPPKGFIESEKYSILSIPKNLKSTMLVYLHENHNLSTETVYNDVHAYIKNQDIPQNAATEFYRGLTCQNRGVDKKAIEHYNKSLNLEPDHAEVHYNRGNARKQINMPKLAIEDYTIAIKLKPNYAEAYVNRGNVHRGIGQDDLAIENYTIAIELNPRLAEAYYNRGNAYGNKNETNFAIKDYTKAIKLKSDYAEAYSNRGSVYISKSEYDLAIKDFYRAIELMPNDPKVYYNCGMAYDFNSKYDLAIENYTKAIRLDPDWGEAYVNRGVAYGKKAEYDLAISDCTTAIELNSGDIKGYHNRGNAYLYKGNIDRAIKDYTKAIELKSDYPETYVNRGTAYLYEGEVDKAIKDYSQAIVLKPKIAESYYTRGEAWLRIGKWEEAQRDLIAAVLQGVDIADKFHNTHDSIAAFEEEMGIKLPEDIVNLLTLRQEPLEIDKETRIALAMKYYENEELSSGLAARLAGVSREEFWYLMGDYGLSLFGTAEDLRAERENAHKARH